MVGLKWIIKIFIILATVCHLCTGYIDMARYKQMPPLYLADDYDQCLRQESTSYCLIYAEIQPQPESSVWQYMDEFYKNATETHYRHDQLYRGVCTSRCRDYPKSYDRWNVREVQPTSDNVEMTRKLYTISRGQKSISEYEQQLHQCVNSEMMQKYNLSVKTFVKYCDNPNEPIEKDSRYSLAIIVFTAIIVINLLSTAYDVYLKSQQNERESIDYYDTKHKNTVNNYLTLFSLYRNFRRLVKPNNSAIGKDLSCIDGFRTIMSMVIVFEHVMLMQFFPLKNPELLETEYSSTFGRWLSHLMPCIELFFVMTGLMLYIKFAKSEYITPTSSWWECMRVYVRMMISRYLRYIPSLLLVIFFTSHMILYIGDGPFWRFSVEPSVLICRNEWWRNVLMIANGDPNDTCCVHTWYIAADFQLYAIFLAVLVITAKCPQYKRLIYTIVGIIGVSTPSIINYMKKLNSIATVMLENFRHFYCKGIETTLYVYLKSYANLNGAFVGIICGELYMNYLKHDKYKKIVGRYLQLAPLFGWPIILSIWYLGTFIIFKENTIWTSMFAIIHRHLSIAIVATVVILRGICTGGGFLSWPIFRPLARVSYQVYLWHPIIIFTLFSGFRQPIESSYFWFAYTHAFIYIMSVILATVIATMVEYPIVEILALFDMKSRQNINRHLKSKRA